MITHASYTPLPSACLRPTTSPSETSAPSLTSRLARSLRGSLHHSTKASLGSALAVDPEWQEDYCHITSDDLPIPLDDDPAITPDSSHTLRPELKTATSRFSFNRLRNISRISVVPNKSIRSRLSRDRLRLPFFDNKSSEEHSILDDFPQPPSYIPTPITPVSAAAFTWPSSRPFVEDNHISKELSRKYSHESRRETLINSFPAQTASSHSLATTCEKSEEISSSRPRASGPLKSLSRVLTRFGRRASSKPHPASTSTPSESNTVYLRPPRPNRPAPDVPVEASPEQTVELPQGKPYPGSQKTYQAVNPLELTASPSPFLGVDLTISARSSFVPPSPSWLSRNVHQIANNDLPTAPTCFASEQLPTPASPSPIPIPPRILVSDCSDTPLLSPLEATAGWLEYPEVYHNRQSFVINPSWNSSSTSVRLFHKEERSDPVNKHDLPEALLLKPSSPFQSVPTPTAGIPSPSPYSPTFYSYQGQYSPVPSHQSDCESDSGFDSPDSKPTLVSDSPRDFFVPTLLPTDPDLPPDFRKLLSTLFIEAGLSIANMNVGKRNDVVDFGGEADYTNMQWFKEAPPAHLRPQPPPAEPADAPYAPDGAVIEQNEAFEFALGAAPNVLYARYKQYGQLGVLAWCAEFGELIDNLKALGFAGNMFVSTRTQALKTCEEILKLRLDIQMQIIVLYLSSQVARMRRFLDGDRAWDDYPEPSFPMDPNAYAK